MVQITICWGGEFEGSEKIISQEFSMVRSRSLVRQARVKTGPSEQAEMKQVR